MDYDEILEAVSGFCFPFKTALAVTHAVVKYSGNAPVTGLRANIVYPFRKDDSPWAVVEWTEGDKARVMGIFQMNESYEVCSSLMHYAEFNQNPQYMNGIPRWEKCCITWTIADIDNLKRLFGAAQHILGILDWSIEDIMEVYCKSNPGDCSDQTYLNPPTLTFN
jgi:hypothetical protein